MWYCVSLKNIWDVKYFVSNKDTSIIRVIPFLANQGRLRSSESGVNCVHVRLSPCVNDQNVISSKMTCQYLDFCLLCPSPERCLSMDVSRFFLIVSVKIHPGLQFLLSFPNVISSRHLMQCIMYTLLVDMHKNFIVLLCIGYVYSVCWLVGREYRSCNFYCYKERCQSLMVIRRYF